GGWKKNEDAGDVLSHGDGSPVDLVMTCASMLRADGWKFRVVLAPDRDSRFFHRELPSLFQFEGWLLEGPDPKDADPVTYFSCQHPLLAPGQVPWNYAATLGYAINFEDGSGAAVQIPGTTAEQNRQDRQWKVTVTDTGDVEVDRKSDWSGLQAFELRAELYRR